MGVAFLADTVASTLPEVIKSVDLTALTNTIEGVIPVVLPISVGVAAIRKGISFFLGMIYKV